MARTKAFDPNEVLLKALGVFGSRGDEGTSLPEFLFPVPGAANDSIKGKNVSDNRRFLQAFYRDLLDQKISVSVPDRSAKKPGFSYLNTKISGH